MRWIVIAALGACSFSPGTLPSDGGGMADDAPLDDVAIDANPDAALDAYDPPGEVRSIDLTDALVTGTHTDFPLLVALTDQPWVRSVANGGTVLRDDGFDIYFSSDVLGENRLVHEIERYGQVSGNLAAWVKIPTLTPQTVIYMHYGDPAITTDQAMPPQVWTNAYQMVVHFNGTGDATGNAGSVPSTLLGAVVGKVGIARTYNGGGDYSDGGSVAAVDDVFAGGGTLEGWFYATGFGGGGFGRIVDKTEYALFVDDTNATATMTFFHACTTGSLVGQWHFGTSSISLNAWHHVAIVFDRDNIANDPTAYIDGVAIEATQDTNPTGSFVSDAAQSLYIGNASSLARGFAGALDELRLSSVVRSADWLVTQHRNQDDPAAFYTVSAPL